MKVANTTTAKLNYKVKACIWIYKRFSQNFFQNLLKVVKLPYKDTPKAPKNLAQAKKG